MTQTIKPVRVLVLTDLTAADPALLDAIRTRAQQGPAQFRVVVPNPAPAEWHPLHPERHDQAAAAETALEQARPAIEAAAGGPVIASVSIRHDPMDVIEGVIYHEPVDATGCRSTCHSHSPGPRATSRARTSGGGWAGAVAESSSSVVVAGCTSAPTGSLGPKRGLTGTAPRPCSWAA